MTVWLRYCILVCLCHRFLMFQWVVYNPFLWLSICKFPSNGILTAEKLRNLFADFFLISVKRDYSTFLLLNGIFRVGSDPAETENIYFPVPWSLVNMFYICPGTSHQCSVAAPAWSVWKMNLKCSVLWLRCWHPQRYSSTGHEPSKVKEQNSRCWWVKYKKNSVLYEWTTTYGIIRYLLLPCSDAYQIVFFFSCYTCHVAYVYIWQLLFLFHFLYNVTHMSVSNTIIRPFTPYQIQQTET